jgi:hypothetical protein
VQSYISSKAFASKLTLAVEKNRLLSIFPHRVCFSIRRMFVNIIHLLKKYEGVYIKPSFKNQAFR